MKVKIQLPQHGISANIVAKDKQGNDVEIDSLVIEPYFFRKDERPPVLFAEVLHEESSIDRIVLAVSGTNGRVVMQHRTDPVKPAFGAKDDKKPAVKKNQNQEVKNQENRKADVSDDIPTPIQ